MKFLIMVLILALTGCIDKHYNVIAPDVVQLEIEEVAVDTAVVDIDTLSIYYGFEPMVEFDQEYGLYAGKEQRLAFKFVSNAGIVRQWRWIVPEWIKYDVKAVYAVDIELRIPPHWEATILDTVDISWWYE